ncbi:MAG: NAD(P)H-dependent oxidoreductase [Desulfobacterales bacterium]|nr:NAD(P)H-dependent oxidoreductase [Desulfobacterales bacterium]
MQPIDDAFALKIQNKKELIKILNASGSPIQNSNTDRAVKTVLEATGAETAFIKLSEFQIEPCRACLCWQALLCARYFAGRPGEMYGQCLLAVFVIVPVDDYSFNQFPVVSICRKGFIRALRTATLHPAHNHFILLQGDRHP